MCVYNVMQIPPFDWSEIRIGRDSTIQQTVPVRESIRLYDPEWPWIVLRFECDYPTADCRAGALKAKNQQQERMRAIMDLVPS